MYNFTAQKNPGLSTAFLKTTYLNRNHFKHRIPCIVWDNALYELHGEDLHMIRLLLQRKSTVKVVASFQTYTNGERVAVCKIHNESVPGKGE